LESREALCKVAKSALKNGIAGGFHSQLTKVAPFVHPARGGCETFQSPGITILPV
jgi:hypothetical protein